MHAHGFTLVEERNLPEVGGTARLWKHEKSGAELLSIANEDENKCFGVNFRTPPENSTGVAHILEHSVLCGSEKYPVKEPFVELLKGSLQTFLNAFTFPDKTCYPVASANLKDFYNLIDVYLDAVFHPRLTENTFRQEGWHIEAENPDSPWTYKGVVYNEMKGVYSSPESIIAERSQQSIFPDTLYSLDSGGDPEIIPSLTWQDFQNFHKLCYQPGNTRFFFWGDDPEEERLRIVEEAIARAIPGTGPVPEVPLQKLFTAPVELEIPYASTNGKALFTLNWLLPERGNVEEALKMEMLEHILEGLPGSPLRRALIESGLGEDTIGSGLETDLRQMFYSTGLKGVKPENIEKAEKLILDTLANLAENGIPAEAVEAAVNSIEFAYRESNTGRFPRGLAAMVLSLSTWLYGEDPLAPLAWEKPLEAIKARLAKGEKIFERAIQKYFLENPHRTKVSLLPDDTLAQKREEKEKAKLASLKESADPGARKKIIDETRQLLEAQARPDSPADLATIPALAISDLPGKNAPIPAAIEKGREIFLINELPTNGILYANLLFPIEQIPEEFIPLLPLFSRSLLDFGVKDMDYATLGQKIAAKTGGLGAVPLTGTRFPNGAPFLYLSLAGKAVESRIDDFFDLYRKVLLEPLTDRDVILARLGQMILEEKARLDYGLQVAGHAAASSRVKARLRPEGRLLEEMGGITQRAYLEELEKLLAANPQKVLDALKALRKLLAHSENLVLNLAGDEKTLARAQNTAAGFLRDLPRREDLTGTAIASLEPLTSLPNAEAHITQGQINYVAKGFNLYDSGHAAGASANVIAHWLRMGRLWEEVRVSGGAYGAFCNYDMTTGNFICASYRDPNIERTLAVYDGLGGYLASSQPSPEQLSQSIIGAVGALDAYLLPDAKAAKSLARYLGGLDDETRQKHREEMLGTDAKDFIKFGEGLKEFANNGTISVIGGSSAAETAERLGWAASKLG